MDLKVNDVSGVTQTQEVNQTKPTDDEFKFTLASAIDDAELKEKLSGDHGAGKEDLGAHGYPGYEKIPRSGQGFHE